MKKWNEKGFTLAELLIVVAIIAVLVAIAIPIFNSQLEKARDSTDQANIRSAYAELAVQLLDGTAPTSPKEYSIAGKGTNDVWDNLASSKKFTIGSITSPIEVQAKANFTKVTFTFTADGITQCELS